MVGKIAGRKDPIPSFPPSSPGRQRPGLAILAAGKYCGVLPIEHEETRKPRSDGTEQGPERGTSQSCVKGAYPWSTVKELHFAIGRRHGLRQADAGEEDGSCLRVVDTGTAVPGFPASSYDQRFSPVCGMFPTLPRGRTEPQEPFGELELTHPEIAAVERERSRIP